MPAVIPASMADILLACQTRLVDTLGIDAAQVDLTIDEGAIRFGSKDVQLRPLNFLSVQEVFDGAGRTATKLKRWMDAICRSRLYLDQTGSSKTHLTDADFSHLRWEESIAQTLAGFWPADEDNNLLTVQPIRIFDGDAPSNKRQAGKVAKEWFQSTVRFEIEYYLLKGAAEL